LKHVLKAKLMSVSTILSRRPVIVAISILCAVNTTSHAQDATVLPEVQVQSGRLAQKQFDAPASLHVIDGDAIRNAGAQVNLSEALAQTPGVVALNRNNYAQDVQISIRGFGSRAAFGLRGIRLITDGIPATTPDGQGQASTVFDLGRAHRSVDGPLGSVVWQLGWRCDPDIYSRGGCTASAGCLHHIGQLRTAPP
jgi:outer membrane receptor protein involved in Fe transport